MDTFENTPYLTKDGSHSLYAPRFNQHYHSTQGAILESQHIFIDLGLLPVIDNTTSNNAISVFEMGFGTGLNTLLTWQIAESLHRQIHYTTIEAYPITREVAELLNYEKEVNQQGLLSLHEAASGVCQEMSSYFTFEKHITFLEDFTTPQLYDVIYYDAFSPRAQPELWTKEVFDQMYSLLKPNGMLITYSSKGDVRRALKASGFTVEKHPGPGYKREIVRALK